MEERFFSSREAAKITGCTLRQLQYWRENDVVVPTINATGTGRSIYYSQGNLMELAVMEYLLSLGLTFEVARDTLEALRKIEPQFIDPQVKKRFMLKWEENIRRLKLVEFDKESAIASLNLGQPVIPLWLDRVHGSGRLRALVLGLRWSAAAALTVKSCVCWNTQSDF